MAAGEFAHLISINENDMTVEPFKETAQVRDFDCGNDALNDFLCTEEVSSYEKEGLGRTHLVYCRGTLVAYFTVSFGDIRIEYLKTFRSFSKFAQMNIESVPALKIGRLAVHKRFQNQGIGRYLIRYIAGMALEMGGQSGVRLLMLQAKPESILFYEKCGFQLTSQVSRERKRINRTMFVDLYYIGGITA
jgi:GNAT superfamily N-acetyltransferase